MILHKHIYYRLKSLSNKEKLAGENEKLVLQQFSMTRDGTHTSEHLMLSRTYWFIVSIEDAT